MPRYIQPVLLFTLAILTGCRDSADSHTPTAFSEPLIAKVLEKVREEYVEKPNEQKMLEGAINGMLTALDPYSCFFTPESFKIYIDSQKGEFGGLGMNVLFIEGVLKVVSPMDDMPAQKAGVRAGDFITHIDGTPILGLSHAEVFKRLHGKPGTSVTLKINRGFSTPFDIKIKRDLIIVNPVKYHTQGNIGYVRISNFNDQTTEKVINAIEAIQKSLNKSLQGLVLDLRNNPGGGTEQAVAVSNLFLDSGIIVQVKSRHSNHNVVYKAKGKDRLRGIPIAILINHGSASASEIVAAALRDNNRAVLIGEKTFGKGSIQDHFTIDKFGIIKVTIALFYTPKGDGIQGKGVQPDILLQTSTTEHFKEAEKLSDAQDLQLQRAIDLLQGLWAVKIRS
jgi:carboxyl-terminal processing protease